MSENSELATKVFDRCMMLIEYGINQKKIDKLIDAFETLFNDVNGFFRVSHPEYYRMITALIEAYENEYGIIDDTENLIFVSGGDL